jgi:hypothetical protein
LVRFDVASAWRKRGRASEAGGGGEKIVEEEPAWRANEAKEHDSSGVWAAKEEAVGAWFKPQLALKAGWRPLTKNSK